MLPWFSWVFIEGLKTNNIRFASDEKWVIIKYLVRRIASIIKIVFESFEIMKTFGLFPNWAICVYVIFWYWYIWDILSWLFSIADVTAPLLILHAVDDGVVPYELGQKVGVFKYCIYQSLISRVMKLVKFSPWRRQDGWKCRFMQSVYRIAVTRCWFNNSSCKKENKPNSPGSRPHRRRHYTMYIWENNLEADYTEVNGWASSYVRPSLYVPSTLCCVSCVGNNDGML